METVIESGQTATQSHVVLSSTSISRGSWGR